MFNVRGNRYRIVCAAHFNARILFFRYVGDHAGYDRLNFRRDMTLVTVPRTAAEEDNEAALARLADLMALDPAPGTPEDAEMDVLATLIEAFERKAYPMPKPS